MREVGERTRVGRVGSSSEGVTVYDMTAIALQEDCDLSWNQTIPSLY